MFIHKLASLFEPAFDWIQVEVTSYCNAACIYCPRTVYKHSWEDRHLPLETFRKLEPVLPKTRHLHLQGWGEPFLHPNFFDMVAIGKAAGCRVGTTTNGMSLGGEIIRRLIGSQLDMIAFSLAGTSDENDRIRKGTRLSKVLEGIRSLKREKEKEGVAKPAVHVAYLLFRSGITDLEKLPGLLKDCGVSDVVVSFLDFVPSEDLQEEVIAPETSSEKDELKARLEGVREEGERLGLRMHHPMESVVYQGGVCSENVLRALCIASDGSVTPCVFTNLRAHQAFYVLAGEKRAYEPLVFGNIDQQSLKDIWQQSEYRAFRGTFRTGKLLPPCRGCPKLRRPWDG